MESNKLWQITRNFLRYRFDLSEDQERAGDTIDAIRRGIVFRGTNLWMLIFAVFVASVGLNVNATAVIIGAMLISPLMGPIMGIGLGVGVNDFDLIKQAAKNLAIMVLFSLATSTLYFFLTPLSEARSELLARTTPAVWDVLIAFFGGLAGIVGATRKEKGNVVAGVAIATALMPPLCTAGYGLASGQWYYFLGAFYLFFINAVFISFSTLLVVRMLKFPQKEFMSVEIGQRVRRNVIAVVLLTLLPSFFMAYNIVQQDLFNKKVQRFVSQEFEYANTQLLKSESAYGREICTLRLYAVGDPLDSTDINRLESRLSAYGLDGTRLEVRQGVVAHQNVDITTLRSGILEDLYRRNEEALADKDVQISRFQSELGRYQRLESDAGAIANELKALQPSAQQFSINSNIFYDFKNKKNDTLPVVYLHTSNRLSRTEQTRIFDWLKVRTASDTLILIQQ